MIWASIEKMYVKRKDGYYQEIINHLVHIRDAAGNVQTKLDRSVVGDVYTENTTHNSFGGVVVIQDENGNDKRLVATRLG